MHALHIQEHLPDERVRHLIDRSWRASAHEAVDDFLVVPDGCVDVLFSVDAGLQMVGTMTTAQSVSLPAGAEVVGVRLKPGAAAPWLRIDVAELTDAQVELKAILGRSVDDLEHRLRSTPNSSDRVVLLGLGVAQALHASWDRATRRERSLQHAFDALTRTHGAASVEWLALQCGLSARQFQRRCRVASGLAPKTLARVLRLSRVVALRAHTGLDWTTIAAHCGFSDHAHLIHDFTGFVGCSPGNYSMQLRDVRFSQSDVQRAHVEWHSS